MNGMRVFVWQWGRKGAGPRIAVELAKALNTLPHTSAILSLSTGAEVLQAEPKLHNDVPVRTYKNLSSFFMRVLQVPHLLRALGGMLRVVRPDVAICAMPGPLDLVMAMALHKAGVPVVVLVHDAAAHPGDGFIGQIFLQRLLIWLADVPVTLSQHVAAQLEQQWCMRGRHALVAFHPPFAFAAPLKAQAVPFAHKGPVRLLFFGRLLSYKGLDLLAQALTDMEGKVQYICRIAGYGPHSHELDQLAALPNVQIDNRWVPEVQVRHLIAWADALVLPYREATQSGVGAAALAAGRWVISTDISGLAEQFAEEPNVLFCKPEAQSLADVLMQFIKNRPAITPNAQSRQEAEQAWQLMAAQILNGVRKVEAS
ncbi:lipopolysaccharide biosynthesis protein [Acetobacter aceti 1023]|nr:lipopolysaccharide biosynthesis protein [Acetobacter aceti 1023]